MKIKMTFQEIKEEKVGFHQGIVEAISFLNTMKSPPHSELVDVVVEDSRTLGHAQNNKLCFLLLHAEQETDQW